MHSDETPDAYLNRVQEYVDALATIGEPVKDEDLVMLVVLGLREEYNGLKTTITARQSLTAFSKLHALLSDHDYMLGKTHAPALSITPSFAANYVVGSTKHDRTSSSSTFKVGCSVKCSWIPNTGGNCHVTPNLASMDTLEAYYGDDALHVGNNKGAHVFPISVHTIVTKWIFVPLRVSFLATSLPSWISLS
ncbi:nucleotide-binding alpha-beta plait domain-containing protein [Tanacetum coccineum]